jgi:hypothetical protein
VSGSRITAIRAAAHAVGGCRMAARARILACHAPAHTKEQSNNITERQLTRRALHILL